MKKSQAVTLTVVAFMGIAANAQLPQQPPLAQPSAPVTCEDRRTSAQAAGTRFTENCGHGNAAHGGFGHTGKSHSSGGG